MNHVYRLLSKIPNYVRRFGLIHGLRLLFQIERRLPPNSNRIRKYVLPNFPAPVYLRDSIADHAIFWQCLVIEQYDFTKFPQQSRLMAAYEDIKRSHSPLIIDCGGNIGLAAAWYAQKFPDAIIYTVEPDKDNLEILKLNTAHFGDRIKHLHGAIWNEPGRLRIINPESPSAAFRVEFTESRASDNSIHAYTIDSICSLARVKNPLIVKIDIEGAQRSLFRSNTNWVNNTHLISLELDDWLMPWEGTSRTFFSCISRYSFDYLLGGESIFCFRDFTAAE